MRILVTGAGSGIGRATALRLVEGGHAVWGTSRRMDRLPKAAGFTGLELDLMAVDGLPARVEEFWELAGGFDVVINNAGGGVFGPLDSLSLHQEEEIFRLLYHAPMVVTRTVLAKMRSAGGGRIIQVTTVGVDLPIPYLGAYSAAKAALAAATSVLRLEGEDSRVRMIEVRPGDIQTEFNRQVGQSEGAESDRAKRQWQKLEALMASAPSADVVAKRLARLVGEEDPSPVVYVGDFFQTRLAPMAARSLPKRWVESMIRCYYGLE